MTYVSSEVGGKTQVKSGKGMPKRFFKIEKPGRDAMNEYLATVEKLVTDFMPDPAVSILG